MSRTPTTKGAYATAIANERKLQDDLAFLIIEADDTSDPITYSMALEAVINILERLHE